MTLKVISVTKNLGDMNEKMTQFQKLNTESFCRLCASATSFSSSLRLFSATTAAEDWKLRWMAGSIGSKSFRHSTLRIGLQHVHLGALVVTLTCNNLINIVILLLLLICYKLQCDYMSPISVLDRVITRQLSVHVTHKDVRTCGAAIK